MSQADDLVHLAPLASLHDPTRRRLYQYVAAASRAVTREQAATALGVDRSLVAYHLDTLVTEGLLVASFARPDGRPGGPGAGRPAKHYARARTEFAVSVPPRDYVLAADVLARAAARDDAMRQAVEAAARDRGRDLGASTDGDTLEDRLAAQGFEPYLDDGVLRLANCPFHRLADQHREVVCGMNLALLDGFLAGAGVRDREARLEPHPDRCCVAFHPTG